MQTLMKVAKAVTIAKTGPKTEAQRLQAIKALRLFAREVEPDYPKMAWTARQQARTLVLLGDMNRR